MKPLGGVKVLDVTNVLAGPYASYQLALMGADVVKVEAPGGGDLARVLGASAEMSSQGMGASFVAQNSAKRSIVIDLKSETGREVFLRLAATADVVVENFRPGVMDRLGVGWEQLSAHNPRLVYCAISGFGQEGPQSGRPAYDQIVQGLSGLMSVTGSPETAPLRVGAPLCDSMGGMAAAMAVCAALVRQRQTGQGAFLDVSMLDATITAMGWVVSDMLLAGVDPRPMANENRTAAPSGTFHTARGELNIAANQQAQWESLCHALQRDDLLSDPRFVLREDRKKNRLELRTELEKTLGTQSAAHWDEVLLRARVPAAPVFGVPEALDSPQVRARELVSELATDSGDKYRVLGGPVRVDGQPTAPGTPPPSLGQHTAEVLREAGYTAAQVTSYLESGEIR